MICTTVLDEPGDVAWDIAMEVLLHGYVEDVDRVINDTILFKGDERMTFTMADEGGSIYGWSYLVEDMYGDPIMEGGDETTNGFENIISFIKNWAEPDVVTVTQGEYEHE